MIVLAWGLTLLMGMLLVWGLAPWRSQNIGGWVLAAGIAILGGIGMAGLSTWLHQLFFYEMSLPVLATDVLLVILLATLAVSLRRSTGLADQQLLPADPDKTWLKGALAGWGLLVIVGAVGTAMVNLARRPWGDWDAIMIWNLRARFIDRAGEDWHLAFQLPIIHPDYPLLWPLNVLHVWRYTGNESFLASQSVSFAFLVAGILVLWGTLRIVRGPVVAWLGVLFLLANPFYLQFGSLQLMDVPIGTFLMAGWAMLILALREDSPIAPRLNAPRLNGAGTWALAGIMLGGMLWTKNEGQLMLLATAVGLCLSRPLPWWRREGAKTAGVLLLGMLPFAIALVMAKLMLAGSSDLVRYQGEQSLIGKLTDPQRHLKFFEVWWGFMSATAPLWSTAGLVLVVMLAGWTTSRMGRVLNGLLIAFTLIVAGYYTVYLLTPHDLEWHLRSSLSRILTQVWPLFVLGTMLGIRLPRWNPSPVAQV